MCGTYEGKSKVAGYADSLDTYKTWEDLGVKFAGMAPEEIRTVLKDNDNEDIGGEEFLSQELIIASALGTAFYYVGQKGEEKILSVLKEEGAHKLEKGIDEAKPYFENVFAYKDTNARVQANLRSAMLVGAEIAGSKRLLDGLFRAEETLKEMVEATKYFTNNYFNNQVVPELQKIVQKIFDNPGISGANVDAEAYKAVREALEKRLKSVPHWRVVANAGASRGFHYGAIKAGTMTGQTGYEIVAILDKKTSKICRHMNKKQFWLADGEVQVSKAAEATGDDIKTVSPWLKDDVITKMTNDELRQAGFIVPPFHGNCRSTIKFVR